MVLVVEVVVVPRLWSTARSTVRGPVNLSIGYMCLWVISCNRLLGPMVNGRLMILSTGRLAQELSQVHDRVRLQFLLRVRVCTVLVPFGLQVQKSILLAHPLLLTITRALTVPLMFRWALTGLMTLAFDDETTTMLWLVVRRLETSPIVLRHMTGLITLLRALVMTVPICLIL